MNMYGGAEVHLHYFSISAVVSQLHASPAFSLGKLLPVPTEYEDGRAPEPVWAVWRREKSVAPAKNEHWIIQQTGWEGKTEW